MPPASDAPSVDLRDRPGVPGVGHDFGAGVQVNVNALGLNVSGDAANEPSIACDPTNPLRMVIGWRQFDSISSNFREKGVAHTTDGGRTWVAGTIEDGVFGSDPVIEADSDGNFYYMSLVGPPEWNCFVFRSTDKGKTWTEKTFVLVGDKPWFVIDKTGLPSDGHVYATSASSGTMFTRSTDGAKTFLSPVKLYFNAFTTITVSRNGDLFVAGNSFSSEVMVTKSTDAKDPNVAPTFLTSLIQLPGPTLFGSGSPTHPNPAGALGLVNVDIDRSGGPYDGHLYVLCSLDPFASSDPMDVYLRRSRDGGQTWDPPVRINNDPAAYYAWQWFGTFSIAPNGRIDVVWNDTRESQNPHISRLYYAFSTDGGQTFQGNTPLTPSWNSTLGWPQQNKIGDYYDMESDLVGVDLAYSATFNNEQDVYYMRINDYDCNKNGLGDAGDIQSGFSKDVNKNEIPDECECLGDINVSGTVGQDDLGILLAAYGTSTGQPGFNPAADIDKDGTVGQSDLGILRAAYGAACP